MKHVARTIFLGESIVDGSPMYAAIQNLPGLQALIQLGKAKTLVLLLLPVLSGRLRHNIGTLKADISSSNSRWQQQQQQQNSSHRQQR